MSTSEGNDPRKQLDGFEPHVINLVREHASSTQWREWLRVPLEHAAAKGDMDLFAMLMDAGADGGAGWRGCHRRTLLGAAAYGKSEEIVQALLEAGATDEVDVKFGAKQESALHVAASQGAEEVSTALMLAGANPCILDADNRNPLHRAAEAGHDGVVDILLLQQADTSARERYARDTPLHLAAAEGHALCVSKLVVGGADKDSRNGNGEAPLHLAARNNRLGAVEEILAAGTNVDIRVHGFYPSCSALDIAAREGHVDVVRALLRHGSNVNACDSLGYAALHHAAAFAESGRDNGDVIRMLLEAGADLEARTTDYYCTPLHEAVRRRVGSSGTIRALLDEGAGVNSCAPGAFTPLHSACFNSCVVGVDVLLWWGADEKLRSAGETPGDAVGLWEEDDVVSWEEDAEGIFFQYTRKQERRADDERIRHMLARAPADRSWRRRGWLVLARCSPNKVTFTMEGNNPGGGGSGCNDASGGCTAVSGDLLRPNFTRLVGSVVGLSAEGIFRLVVSFL